MTFSIDNPEGGCNNPLPLGKYVWEKPSGEQGLRPPQNAATRDYMGITRLITIVQTDIAPSLRHRHNDMHQVKAT